MLEHAVTTLQPDCAADPATLARLSAMATFRDSDASRRQIGVQLGPLEADFARCISLPIYPTMDEAAVRQVIEAVSEVCESARR